MATRSADVVDAGRATRSFTSLVDQWIYVFMAGLFVATVLAGFIPDSVGLIAAVRAHQRPPLPAATDRLAQFLGWPTTDTIGAPALDLYPVLLLLPLFVYDLVRQRHVPRAYVIWFMVNLPFVIALNLLWGSPWWWATAPKLMHVQGW